MERVGPEPLERCLCRERDRGLVALEVEQLLERLGQALVIVDNQDLRGHLSSLRGPLLSRGYARALAERSVGVNTRCCTISGCEVTHFVEPCCTRRAHHANEHDGERASEAARTLHRFHNDEPCACRRGWSARSAERVPQPHRSI